MAKKNPFREARGDRTHFALAYELTEHMRKKDPGAMISAQAVQRWEVGRGFPRPAHMMALCAVTGRPVEFFYTAYK